MLILGDPICRFRTDAVSSFNELNPLGDIGGDSDGGDTGGEYSVEVGDNPNDPLASNTSRLGDPSYNSLTLGLVCGKTLS